MLRVSKLADYAIVVMAHLSSDPDRQPLTARQLSEESGLPLPTVAKILKALSRAGLLVSHRGGCGGYTLARPKHEISVAAMICAIDGSLSLMGCASDPPDPCDIESHCPVRENWAIIARVLREALERLTLDNMTKRLPTCVPRVNPQIPKGRPGKRMLTLVRGNRRTP